MICNLDDLAHTIGAGHQTEESIAKRLFKDTECGITFSAHAAGVTVAGFAEGSDAECPPHALDYPFSAEEFEAAITEADTEGCEAFDDANEYDEHAP